MLNNVLHQNSYCPFFDSVTFELTIKNLLAAIEDMVDDIKPDSQGNKDGKEPPKSKNNKRLSILILGLLFIGIFFFKDIKPGFNSRSNLYSDQSNIELAEEKEMISRHIQWQCILVMAEFKGAFWEYIHDNQIINTEDLEDEDKKILKSELWKIILSARKIFSSVNGMSDLERKVDTYYNYDRFETDFDSFVATHTTGSIKDFEREMIEFMRNRQGEILDMVSSKTH